MTLPIRIDPHSAPDETLHVTASGLPVRVYATDCGGSYPIHGAIFRDGKWQPRSWDANGTYLPGEYEDYFDLRDRPKAKRGWWVGVYTKGDLHHSNTFPSKDDALAFYAGPGWTLFALTYLKEGDGLDTPADPPLRVDWSKLPEWAKWVGADEDGCVWGYDKKPKEGGDAWCIRSNYRCIEIKSPPLYRLAPGFKWQETLIQRPEDV